MTISPFGKWQKKEKKIRIKLKIQPHMENMEAGTKLPKLTLLLLPLLSRTLGPFTGVKANTKLLRPWRIAPFGPVRRSANSSQKSV